MNDHASLTTIDDDQQNPMRDAFGGIGDMDAAPGGRPLMSYGLVVAFVIVVGGAGIFAMRKAGMGAGVDFKHTAIEYTSSAQSAVERAKFERVLATLERSGTPVQVDPEALELDPFFLASAAVATADHGDAGELARQRAEADRLRREEAEALRLQSAFERLELQSVLTGRFPMASINNTIVRVGDVVDDTFTVLSIDSSGVVLEAQDTQFTLVSD